MARRLASLVCARSLKAHRPAVSEGPPFGGEGKPRKRVAEDQAFVLEGEVGDAPVVATMAMVGLRSVREDVTMVDQLTLSLAVEVRS